PAEIQLDVVSDADPQISLDLEVSLRSDIGPALARQRHARLQLHGAARDELCALGDFGTVGVDLSGGYGSRADADEQECDHDHERGHRHPGIIESSIAHIARIAFQCADWRSISSRRRILPVADLGIWSMNSTSRTRLCGATRSATQLMSASAVVAGPAAAGLSTTYALGTSPASSSARSEERRVGKRL